MGFMTTATTQSTRLDQFFTVAEARFDRWRKLLQTTRDWESATKSNLEREIARAAVSTSLQELRQWEDFFAYPGPSLIRTLEERIVAGDATGCARLVQAISTALLTHSYRSNASDWENDDQSPVPIVDHLPRTGEASAPHRPYFEVLVVSPARPSAWINLAQDLRKLRRAQDRFVYETVFVGNFEDAVLGTILNGPQQSRSSRIPHNTPFGQ
jgi:arginine decarboxylase